MAPTRPQPQMDQVDEDEMDEETRAMSRNPELMAVLRAAQEQAKQPGGTISAEELERRRPLPPEAKAEGQALLARWLAEDVEREATE